ncbi:MAG: hypothetical protein ABIB72_04265 [Candidatus Falkowbacteria bacterium]
MFIKTCKISGILALSGLFCGLVLFIPFGAYAVENIVENTDIMPAADNLISVTNTNTNTLPAGFYQFNSLEIFKGPVVDEPPATIEAIQKYDISCFVYENGKTDKPLPCVFSGDKDNYFTVQIDERTTLLGVNQEPALLIDFQAGDKINVLGWLAADAKTIRAAVIRNLEKKNYHQSLSGTIKKVTGNGFTITLDNGDEVFVKTPIVEGAQVTIKGVFDEINDMVNNVLSIFIKPFIVLQEKPAEVTPPAPAPAPSAKPSTLFRNFLKVFGL